MNSFGKDEALLRLAQLDDDLLSLYGTSRLFEMTITGGSALMIMELTQNMRYTTDIDVLEASPEIEGLLERYDMNTNVSTFLYKYPEGWKNRRTRVPFEGQTLNVYTLSNEDLALTKLISWRSVDKCDLVDMLDARSIDLRKLKGILDDITEVRVNLDDDEWESLLDRFSALSKGEVL